MLEALPVKKIHVFVVWMPVLVKDLGPPSTGNLARVPDRRVTQYWDPKRGISKRLLAVARAHPDWLSEDERIEVNREGFVVWDFVAVYRPGARWEGDVPRPDYHGGPVVHVRDALLSFLQ